jgi:hypothetical protein
MKIIFTKTKKDLVSLTKCQDYNDKCNLKYNCFLEIESNVLNYDDISNLISDNFKLEKCSLKNDDNDMSSMHIYNPPYLFFIKEDFDNYDKILKFIDETERIINEKNDGRNNVLNIKKIVILTYYPLKENNNIEMKKEYEKNDLLKNDNNSIININNSKNINFFNNIKIKISKLFPKLKKFGF